jgi:aspartyl-tRNA synthetase
MSIICDTKSIRDVIAFPKSLDGKDLMSGAPSSISEKEKEMYHIGAVHNK